MAAVDAALMRYRRELLCCVILELSRHAVPLGEGEVRSVELAACKTLASAIFPCFLDPVRPSEPKLCDDVDSHTAKPDEKKSWSVPCAQLKYSLPLDRL